MLLAKIVLNGEDLTAGKGTLISVNDVREIESQGFAVIIIGK